MARTEADGTAAVATEPAPPELPSPERRQDLLFDAARLGRTDVADALLRFGADLEARDDKGHTPLILACYNDRSATAALLLDRGAAPDTGDAARGNTALMGVAFKGYEAFVDRLLLAGANPDVTNNAGQTALMMAALFGHSAIVDRLLTAGADPLAVDVEGNTAGSVARGQGNDLMVARLTR